jgi:multidrug efflux system membrane fusion protein
MSLAILVLFFSNGCAPKKKPPVAAVSVVVATATVTNLPMFIEPAPVGHVMPYSSVTINSQIQGILSQVYFKEGQEVKAGDPLFLIDPRPSQAAVDQARANLLRDSGQLEYQKANHARDLKLLESKIISQDQIETDTASLDAATGTIAADKAALTNALLNLEFCHINAPMDGVLGALQSFIGNVVKAPGDTLVTLNQIHPIYVQFAVPEQSLPQIKHEMSLHPLTLTASYENMTVAPPKGTLTFVDNTVDTTTGTIQLRGTFLNQNDALWPGQFVTIQLTLLTESNAVVVPTQAVQTGQNGEFVYVVKPDQTVEERDVTIGVANDVITEIKSGLKAGESVVTDGQMRLAPRTAVSIKSSANANTNPPAANSASTNSM